MCNLKKKNKTKKKKTTGTLLEQVLLQVSLVSPTKTHKDIHKDKRIVQLIDSEPIYNGGSKQNKKAYSMTTKIKIKLELRVLEKNIFQRVNKWKLQIFLFFIYLLF